MACRACGSEKLITLKGELTASLKTLDGAKQTPLYLCQNLVACATCGHAELQIPPQQLQDIAKHATQSS